MKVIKKYHQVGRLLRSSRRDHPKYPLTQKDVANLVGLANCGLIANIERGTHDIPRDKVRVYATALKIDALLIIDAKARDYQDFEVRHLTNSDQEIRQKISSMFGGSNIKEGE